MKAEQEIKAASQYYAERVAALEKIFYMKLMRPYLKYKNSQKYGRSMRVNLDVIFSNAFHMDYLSNRI